MKRYLLLFLIFLTVPAFAEQLRLQKGEIAEKVPSSKAGFSHAVYIPSNYSPNKKWPVLYCFDAREHGKIPAELFKEGAEKFGYLIFSSNNSRSDDPNANNVEALIAMWNDSHAWFPIDDRRTYATGFSGGSRVAWGMGFVKSLAGVIGCGAGSHPEKPPAKDIPFVYYGIVGNIDFNYHELRQLDQQLKSLGIARRIAFFDGPHEWPPKESCTKAIEWMELQAMKQKRREPDSVWIGEMYQKQLAQVKAQDEASNLFEAFSGYEKLTEDFDGLVDVAEIRERAAALEKTDQVQKHLKRLQEIDKQEEETVNNYRSILQELHSGDPAPSAGKIKNELRISHWKERIEKAPDHEEELLARRLLETAFVQTSFYLPQIFTGRKDYKRLLTSQSIASEIHPEYSWVWYNLACAYALKGDEEKAIANLELAVSKGFNNRQLLETDHDLDNIRKEEGFQALIQKLPGTTNQ